MACFSSRSGDQADDKRNGLVKRVIERFKICDKMWSLTAIRSHEEI
jgi:hypothetical protein